MVYREPRIVSTFGVERNQPFGEDPNVVAHALGDHVDVTPSSDALLVNLVKHGCFHSPNFRRKAAVDLVKARIERLLRTHELRE